MTSIKLNIANYMMNAEGVNELITSFENINATYGNGKVRKFLKVSLTESHNPVWKFAASSIEKLEAGESIKVFLSPEKHGEYYSSNIEHYVITKA